MKVQVRFFSILRDLAGGSLSSFELPAKGTINDLIDLFKMEQYERLWKFISDEKGQLKGYVKLVRNGELKQPETDEPLNDGDEFHLFVASTGG